MSMAYMVFDVAGSQAPVVSISNLPEGTVTFVFEGVGEIRVDYNSEQYYLSDLSVRKVRGQNKVLIIGLNAPGSGSKYTPSSIKVTAPVGTKIE